MRYMAVVLAVLFAVTFVTGIALFPDGPIRPCDAGFCGKYGKVYDAAAYAQYRAWSIASVGLFLATFVAGGVAAVVSARKSR